MSAAKTSTIQEKRKDGENEAVITSENDNIRVLLNLCN